MGYKKMDQNYGFADLALTSFENILSESYYDLIKQAPVSFKIFVKIVNLENIRLIHWLLWININSVATVTGYSFIGQLVVPKFVANRAKSDSFPKGASKVVRSEPSFVQSTTTNKIRIWYDTF